MLSNRFEKYKLIKNYWSIDKLFATFDTVNAWKTLIIKVPVIWNY